jgi:hypothetical protein
VNTQPEDPEEVAWHRSADAPGSVEIAYVGDEVWVRKVGEPDTVITFPQDAWRSFVRSILSGERLHP